MRQLALVLSLCTLPLVASAQTGEEGAVCVHQFVPGVSCDTSTDITVEQLEAVAIDETCFEGDPASALLTFEAVIANNSSGLFDVALFFSLNGDSALSGGQCYHDYLAPPLTTTPAYPITDGPWANLEPFDPGDACGDMDGGLEITKTMAAPGEPLRVACTDTNANGTVDISVCTGWRAGSTGPQARCEDLSDALPASGSRCHCARVEILPEPSAALALACGAALLARLRRRAD